MYWLLFITVFIILVYLGIKSAKKTQIKLRELGYLPGSAIVCGKMVGGHPDFDEIISKTIIFSKGGMLEILYGLPGMIPVFKAKIPLAAVKNVLAEDQTTVEKRVTVGRLLTLGVFAFALKKKTKNQLAYLTIEWNDGRFDHDTIFEFEGNGALQNANIARNKLIKAIR